MIYKKEVIGPMTSNEVRYWCLGRDLNPHSHEGPRDFKSLASTRSATQAEQNHSIITIPTITFSLAPCALCFTPFS